MKKSILLLAISLVVLLAFAGCSKPAEEPANNGEPATEETTIVTPTESTQINNEASSDVGYDVDGEQIIFTVSHDFELESDAWLGVIPTGTIYENEVDADEVDMIYAYCDNFGFDGATSYSFAFEKEYFIDSIADGTYDLVLCSSDNEEIGKVLLQIGIEKQGDQITLDYENEK